MNISNTGIKEGSGVACTPPAECECDHPLAVPELAIVDGCGCCTVVALCKVLGEPVPPIHSAVGATPNGNPSNNSTSRSRRTSSFTASHLYRRTRPLKVLIYSADGYTESSISALYLLLTIRGLSLPEAYLELPVKKRSFFVHQNQNDLGVLRWA